MQLLMVYLWAMAWPASLAGSIPGQSPASSFFAPKTAFLESKPQLSSGFCTFLGSPWTCLGNSKPDPPKKGCEVKFGRRGKLRCHRIDEFSKQNCPPAPSQDPRRPPRTLPGGFGNPLYFFKFFWFPPPGVRRNLLAVPRSRFAGAGDGSQCLTVSYRYTRCIETGM